MRHRGRPRRAPASLLAAGVMVAAGTAVLAQHGLAGRSAARPAAGIHKIRHVIVIMQENRSFDSYFGTFPGADGIPAGVCLPDSRNGGCDRPWADHHDSNANNPHDQPAFLGDVAGGRMNGFVKVAEQKLCQPGRPCHPDVMGYHPSSDIPDYWAYASHFVLQDHFF
jgi:phospholipase C